MKNASETTPRRVRAPHSDLRRANGELVLSIELPGVALQDVEIALEGDELTVRGKRAGTLPDGPDRPGGPGGTAGLRALAREFEPAVDFERSFRLSDEVAAEGIQATFKAGVLELRLTKRSPERRTIPVLSN